MYCRYDKGGTPRRSIGDIIQTPSSQEHMKQTWWACYHSGLPCCRYHLTRRDDLGEEAKQKKLGGRNRRALKILESGELDPSLIWKENLRWAAQSLTVIINHSSWDFLFSFSSRPWFFLSQIEFGSAHSHDRIQYHLWKGVVSLNNFWISNIPLAPLSSPSL